MTEYYRRYQRYSISAGAVVTRRDAGPQDRLNAQIVTISRGGMGFYADRSLEKATPVTIEFLSEAMRNMGVLEGRIASIFCQDDDFFVGIAFDREIPIDRFSAVIS